MRLLYLIFIVFASCMVKGQDIIDPPALDSTSSSLINSDYNGFILGWNWGSPGAKLDSAWEYRY